MVALCVYSEFTYKEHLFFDDEPMVIKHGCLRDFVCNRICLIMHKGRSEIPSSRLIWPYLTYITNLKKVVLHFGYSEFSYKEPISLLPVISDRCLSFSAEGLSIQNGASFLQSLHSRFRKLLLTTDRDLAIARMMKVRVIVIVAIPKTILFLVSWQVVNMLMGVKILILQYRISRYSVVRCVFARWH